MPKITSDNVFKLAGGIILLLLVVGFALRSTDGFTKLDETSFTIEEASPLVLFVIFYGMGIMIFKLATNQVFSKNQVKLVVVAAIAVFVVIRYLIPELGVQIIAPLESVVPFIVP